MSEAARSCRWYVGKTDERMRVGNSTSTRTATQEEPISDAKLVEASLAGQKWAREALFERHAPMVSGLSYRLLGHDTELDDVVQDSFVQALGNLHKLRDPTAFGSWLGSITVHTVRKTISRRRMLERLGLRRPTELNDDIDVSVNAPPEVVVELRTLYRALQNINVEARLALLLKRVEGYTTDEVAAELSLSASTVKRRLNEANDAVELHRRQRRSAPELEGPS